ncbi:hypothetical protein [uncultured Treponema sp.]|uniref:hypothetical protein n=1 Tax=uncultured Treponema sp. TaxID=162155 RepID=UPI002622B3A3|nr:hypothetical protein [uncultured Treponema sp.]
MKKSDLIRATDSFKAFDSFNNLFCNSWLVGILAASKALYHRITIGDAIELFGKNAGVAIDLLAAFSNMADTYDIKDIGLFVIVENNLGRSNKRRGMKKSDRELYKK